MADEAGAMSDLDKLRSALTDIEGTLDFFVKKRRDAESNVVFYQNKARNARREEQSALELRDRIKALILAEELKHG